MCVMTNKNYHALDCLGWTIAMQLAKSMPFVSDETQVAVAEAIAHISPDQLLDVEESWENVVVLLMTKRKYAADDAVEEVVEVINAGWHLSEYHQELADTCSCDIRG